jgi:SAM-dependent methyltransferase
MRRKDCRLCHDTDLSMALSLTPTPPANEFVANPKVEQDCFPLELFKCNACEHYQLLDIVDPNRLFKNYVYVSGTSPVFVRHFRNYACDLVSSFDPAPKSLVVDIGSNDGTLLREFRNNGLRVLGVDPACNIATEAFDNHGIFTIDDFFNQEVAREIVEHHGKATLITANNVFAHADDLDEITLGVKNLLEDDGVFTFEVSYFGDVVAHNLFDTIYHEHLSYHTIKPLIKFFQKHSLKLFNVKHIDTHGGSIRGYVCHASNPNHRAMDNCHEGEINIAGLSDKIEQLKQDLSARLHELKSQGKTIVAFGAPAKATTLMYHFDLGEGIIDFVVDDSLLKQGLYTPGKHIPVLSSSALYEQKPDYVVILAWNFAEPIIKQHQKFIEQGGHFIVPIPELKEV